MRKLEAALLHDAEVAALDLEHVEVVEERTRSVKTPTGARDERDHLAAVAKVVGGQRAPLEEPDHECVVLRQ